MKASVLAPVVVVMFAAGCANTQVKMDKYTPAPLKEAEIMPSRADLAGAAKRVVVLPAKDDHFPDAAKSGVGVAIGNSIEAHLGKAGLELVERELSQQAKDEIALAEMKGSTGYRGPEVADYVITSVVNKAGVGRSFTAATSYKDKKKKVHIIPAKCTFSAEVSANVKILEMPSMRAVQAVALSGSASSGRETSDSHCPISPGEYQALMRSAAADAVRRGRTDLQNYFAPKGYVLERRVSKDGGSIFKVSLGRDRGAKEGQNVHFYKTTETKNPLTGQTIVEEYEVAEGVISNQVGPAYSWVSVGDGEKAAKLRLGDFMKPKFEKGFFEGLGD